ncbi:MAG TPA: DUF6089 family protein [Bacteroidia bacterium]|nr:DUF6089 family protein [Bacteroidia bacterium]
MKRLSALLLLICLLPGLSIAQRYKQRWKAYRSELSFGIGASNFLGDLGGANKIGTNDFQDLEFSETNIAISAGIRYKLNPILSLNTHLTYGQVSGSDALTQEFFRNYRNLNFKTNIWELNSNLEIAFIKEQTGHRYRLKGVRGQRGFEFSAYGFLGLGAFYFNPKGELNGQWYDLQPLHTEGQGLAGTRSQYKKLQLCIPMGIGFRYAFNRRWGVGLEYGIRKTFTDYIDDVSKTYYDNASIQAANGVNAALLADKSWQNEYVYPYITAAGAQRGDPRDKDTYMFAIISVTYKLRSGRSSFPMF